MTTPDDALMPDEIWIAGRATCSGMWSTKPSGIDKYYEPIGPFIPKCEKAQVADLPAPPVRGDDAVRILYAAISAIKIAYKDDPTLVNSCERAMRHAKEALSQPQPGVQWQTIETAPREGVSFLVLGKHKTDKDFSIVQASWFEGRLYADSKENVIDWDDGLQATHWMPLPAPPEKQS